MSKNLRDKNPLLDTNVFIESLLSGIEIALLKDEQKSGKK
jgi:hypothetical protein